MGWRFVSSLVGGVLCVVFGQGHSAAVGDSTFYTKGGKNTLPSGQHVHSGHSSGHGVVRVSAHGLYEDRAPKQSLKMVEVKVEAASGHIGVARVALRNKNLVRHIIKSVGPDVSGLDVRCQADVDGAMRTIWGRGKVSRAKRDATFAVSLAIARAGAAIKGIHEAQLYRYIAELHGAQAQVLPIPFVTAIRGGPGADSSVDFRTIDLVAGGAGSVSQAYRLSHDVFHRLGTILKLGGDPGGQSSEGGYLLRGDTTEDALQLVTQAINDVGHAGLVHLAVDVGANALYQRKTGVYRLGRDRDQVWRNGQQVLEELRGLVDRYPITSITDGLQSEDQRGWQRMTTALGDRVQIVGGAVFGSQAEMIAKGNGQGSGGRAKSTANAVRIDPQESGSVTDILGAIAEARSHGWAVLFGNGMLETSGDPAIVHLAAGTGALGVNHGPSAGLTELWAIQTSMERDAKMRRGPAPQFAGSLDSLPWK